MPPVPEAAGAPAAPELPDSEKIDRLRLIRTANVGPVTFGKLVRRFGSATRALGSLPELAARGGGGPMAVCSKQAALREMAALEAAGGHFLFLGDKSYPPLLAMVEDAPPVLSVIGPADLTRLTCIGIVGARNASANGRKLAGMLAASLGMQGIGVVSGMARGIDTAAHQGALPHVTIAVLAGGVDIIYPRENAGLYRAIQENGAVISESPFGAQPQARHFPRRNRIISGLSRAVVVVEAALRSGSLITARFAAEQGRDVFAVPGSPLDPRCRGTNALLRDGAGLCEDAGDILANLPAPVDLPAESFPPATGAADPEPAAAVTDTTARARLLTALGPAPVRVDALVRMLDLPAATVMEYLLELELAGRVERQPGGMVSLLC